METTYSLLFYLKKEKKEEKAAYFRWRDDENEVVLAVTVHDVVQDTTAAVWYESLPDSSFSLRQVEQIYHLRGEYILPLLKDFGIS